MRTSCGSGPISKPCCSRPDPVIRLYDVINFNCDASCLDSEAWMAAMAGGMDSAFCRWLRLYVRLERPVALGLTGATLCDLQSFNPEAIALIRDNPAIFQVIWRPFAHDLPFFRTEPGFEYNVRLGRRAAEALLGRVDPIFLPPEFMQTNRQTALLAEQGARATMVMASRFNTEVVQALPSEPFSLQGIPDGDLACIPAAGPITKAYLQCMQMLDIDIWDRAVDGAHSLVLWRDGESPFLIPDGVERERFWLERAQVERAHLPVPETPAVPGTFTYPVHPFSAWMDEMSMLWFIQRVRDLEANVMAAPTAAGVARWLHCINSDILSAVEKRSPVVQLRSMDGDRAEGYRITRSSRGFEGEALLVAAERGGTPAGERGWERKARARERMIDGLLS